MTTRSRLVTCGFLVLVGLLSVRVHGQVTVQRLINAATESQSWLTYSGSYWSQRYSLLDQITPANVKNLKLQWVYQAPVAGNWQTTPIVADGVMYITQRPNDVLALDPVTGRVDHSVRPTVCNIVPLDEMQGEGVTWVDDAGRLAFTSEGREAPLHLASCPLP